jgi:hypothetical protein
MLQLLICEVDHLPTVATRDLLLVCQQFNQSHICLVAVRAMNLKTKLYGIDHGASRLGIEYGFPLCGPSSRW